MRKKAIEAKRTFEILSLERHRALDHGAGSLADVHSIGLYFAIVSVDLSVLSSRLLLEHDETIKNVYARHLVLLIYELLDDAPGLLGNRFRQICAQLPKGTEHLAEVRVIGKALGKMKKQHSSDFYAIRNLAVAHRDFDGEKQYNALQALDSKVVFSLATELEVLIGKLFHRLAIMTGDYSWSRLSIREIAEKIKQEGPALPVHAAPSASSTVR